MSLADLVAAGRMLGMVYERWRGQRKGLPSRMTNGYRRQRRRHGYAKWPPPFRWRFIRHPGSATKPPHFEPVDWPRPQKWPGRRK
jgi:hypothetical protein